MGAIGTVFKSAQPVIPPGPGQIDGAGTHPLLRRKAAVQEAEPFGLLQRVGRGGGIADIPRVRQGADFTPLKQRLSAAEDKVHRALDETV